MRTSSGLLAHAQLCQHQCWQHRLFLKLRRCCALQSQLLHHVLMLFAQGMLLFKQTCRRAAGSGAGNTGYSSGTGTGSGVGNTGTLGSSDQTTGTGHHGHHHGHHGHGHGGSGANTGTGTASSHCKLCLHCLLAVSGCVMSWTFALTAVPLSTFEVTHMC